MHHDAGSGKGVRMRRLLMLLCCVLFAAGTSSCAFVTVPLVPGTFPLAEKTLQGKGRDKILLIDVSGILSSESREGFAGMRRELDHVAVLKEVLEKAAADSSIKALVLRINSPGGSVTASDIMYRELLEFKAQHSIPVIACMLDVAASGGYYIAMAADSVHAHPTTVTGSIGVIALKFNIKGLLDRVGVSEETITSAALKDSMSPFRGMTEQERAILQSILDDMHARFENVVRSGRPKLDAQQVTALADGRVFTAEQARKAGLIDEVGYLDDALEAAKQRAGLRSDARVVIYHRPNRYSNNIYSQSSINLISIGADGPGPVLPLRFMYLWKP
jgi:protease IV